jgi:hypothetical protein
VGASNLGTKFLQTIRPASLSFECKSVKYSARVSLPVRLRMDGGQFIQFASTISQLTGAEHVSIEDGPDDYAVTFVFEADSSAEARGEARACVGAGLQRLGRGDLEFFSVDIGPA